MKWDKIQEEVGETVFLKQLKKMYPLEEHTYWRMQTTKYLFSLSMKMNKIST